jgi:hypothetical protein
VLAAVVLMMPAAALVHSSTRPRPIESVTIGTSAAAIRLSRSGIVAMITTALITAIMAATACTSASTSSASAVSLA